MQKITCTISQPPGVTFIKSETHGAGLKPLGGWNKLSLHSLLNLNGIESSFKNCMSSAYETNIRMKGSMHNVIHENIKKQGTEHWSLGDVLDNP